MENGFYHPTRGYWQTTGNPSQEIRNAYPSGTVEVGLPPVLGHVFDGSAWAAPVIDEAAQEAAALAAEAAEIDAVQNSATFKLLAGALGVDAAAVETSKAALVEERRAARVAARQAARNV